MKGARGVDGGDERVNALACWGRKACKFFEVLALAVGMLWLGVKVGGGRAFSSNEDVRDPWFLRLVGPSLCSLGVLWGGSKDCKLIMPSAQFFFTGNNTCQRSLK